MSSNLMMPIILVAVILIVLVFMIISTVSRKKADKKERKERKRIVRDEIKRYIADTENTRNISVEFEKVFARKGEAYKYRDVFDVVVSIRNPKTMEVLEQRAYEVEGLTTKLSKKEFKTSWKVNGQVDLQETNRKIAIAEKRIKLNKEDRKKLRIEQKQLAKEVREQERTEYEEMRKKVKEAKKLGLSITASKKENDENKVQVSTKFIPQRKK